MSRAFSGGKRNREVARDLKKRDKAERLRRNRDMRARGIDPDTTGMAGPAEAPLPEVKLEDVVISVASRSREADFGPTKLFVGGISRSTTAGDLRTLFSKFGEITDAVVIQSRGFGFVSYRNATAADAATKEMNGVEVDGHPLRVNRADTRPSRF